MSETDQVDDLRDDIASQVVDTPEKAPEPAKSVNDPTGLRETITKAVRESAEKAAAGAKPADHAKPTPDGERQRGADGKFLQKDAAPAPDKAAQPQKQFEKPLDGAQPGAVQSKQADAAPGTWRTEAKAKWETLDPLVKAEVLKREDERSREVAKYQQQISHINNTYGPVEKLIGPRRALWRAQFGSEDKALERLFHVSDLASQSPNDFLAFYLSQPDVAAKVDMQRVLGTQAPTDDIRSHPVVSQLQQTVNGLQQQLQGFLGHQQSQQVQTIEQQITEYASAKGPDGTPMRPHFDAVRDDVFSLIPALKAQFPQATVSQILDKAYQTAIHTNDTVSGEVRKIEEERIRSEIERADRARRAQAANKSIPSGTPGNASNKSPVNATDLRAELVRNFRANQRGETARV